MPWKQMLAWVTGRIDEALHQRLEFVLEENRVYRARAPQVLVDDDDPAEAQLAGARLQIVLTLLAFAMMTHLILGRLPHIDVGGPLPVLGFNFIVHGRSFCPGCAHRLLKQLDQQLTTPNARRFGELVPERFLGQG